MASGEDVLSVALTPWATTSGVYALVRHFFTEDEEGSRQRGVERQLSTQERTETQETARRKRTK
jgi:hypothetical protein